MVFGFVFVVDGAEQHPAQQGDALAAVRFGQAWRLVGAAESEHQLSVILLTPPLWLIQVVGVHALQSGQFPDVVQAEPPTRSGHRTLSKESPPAGLWNKPPDRTSMRARRASNGPPAAHKPSPAHRQRSRKFREVSRIGDEMDREFGKTNQPAHCGAWLFTQSHKPEPSQHNTLRRVREALQNKK